MASTFAAILNAAKVEQIGCSNMKEWEEGFVQCFEILKLVFSMGNNAAKQLMLPLSSQATFHKNK